MLGHRDVDLLLAVVGEAASSDGPQPFELPVIERLQGLVSSDRAGYFEYRVPGCELYRVRNHADHGWSRFAGALSPPAVWPLHDGLWRGMTYPVKWSDFVGRRQRLRHPWYLEVMRRTGVEHEIKFWLPSPDGVVRGFYLSREPGRPDFEERDREVLRLLRRHLAAVRARWERRRSVPGLTQRELEVLSLVREGLTNAEIAGRLVVSTTTVRTHLENIFEKLDVHTRTAAARALHTSGVNIRAADTAAPRSSERGDKL
jgi:DNA-binding CsgD family transcriptional regulator